MEFQVLNIVGEQVSFVPTGLSPQETAIVEFDKMYRPEGLSEEQATVLKNTMKAIFAKQPLTKANASTGEESDETTRDPFPPCDEVAKDLVIQSLLHRKQLLESQLYELGIILSPNQLKTKILELEQTGKLNTALKTGQESLLKGASTLLEETHLTHWRNLTKFIKTFESSPSCVSLGDLSYKDIVLDLTDEKIQELLKQFVFFLLQGKHPLKDYEGTDPTSPAFIARLQKKPLGTKFGKFLETYKANKLPIPPPIAKVLQATDLDPAAMAQAIQDAIDAEHKRILAEIKAKFIPETDPIWSTLSESPTLLELVDRLRERQLEAEDEIKALQQQILQLTQQVKACEQAKTALQADQARAQARIAELEEDEKKELVDVNEEYERRIAELEKQIQELTEEKEATQTEIDRLTFENQDLKGEMYKYRDQIEDLEALNRKAKEDLDALRAEHAASLAAAEARVGEKEAARAAAVAAAEDATTKLATTTTELASTKASLESANKLVETKEQTISELTKTLAEKDAALATTREELSKKTAEAAQVAAQLAETQLRMGSLTERIGEIETTLQGAQNVAGELIQDITEADEEIARLTEELNAEKTKAEDLQTQLNKCEEEKKVLQGQASADTRSAAELAGKLRAAEEEKGAAQARVDELATSVKRLEGQLAEEKAARERSQAETLVQKARADAGDQTIAELTEESKQKDETIAAATGRVEDAEAKRKQAEDALVATIQEKDAAITKTKEELETQFNSALQETKEEFEATLKSQREALEQELGEASQKTLADTQESYEAALQAQKERYEKALSVVQQMATWIDSGADGDVTEVVSVDPDTIQRDALGSILTKLQEQGAGPVSPTVSRLKDSTINLCYMVFLVSFLWQTNLRDPESSPTYTQTKLIEKILSDTLNGGNKPTKETWASPAGVKKPYEFHMGFYDTIVSLSGSPKTRGEFGGHLQQPRDIVRRLLSLFHTLARALESPPKEGTLVSLTEVDKAYLKEFLKLLKKFSASYKEALADPTLDPETQLGSLASTALKSHQPLVNPSVLQRYVNLEEKGVRIFPTKPASGAGAEGEDPTQLNYAVLFYAFLVVMRDFLHHTEGTISKQCPLPPFLHTGLKK